jgi:hypothetical protein
METGERTRKLTADLRLMGQPEIGPSEVEDQSNAAIRSASSPKPVRKLGGKPGADDESAN